MCYRPAEEAASCRCWECCWKEVKVLLPLARKEQPCFEPMPSKARPSQRDLANGDDSDSESKK